MSSRASRENHTWMHRGQVEDPNWHNADGSRVKQHVWECWECGLQTKMVGNTQPHPTFLAGLHPCDVTQVRKVMES